MHILHFSYADVMNMSMNEFLNWALRAQNLALGDYNLLKFRQEEKESEPESE